MTTQYAFFADVHGNYPAMEAVLDDIASRGIQTIYFLGDMAGKGPSSAEVIDRIRFDERITAVYGNWDRLVSGNYQGQSGPWYRERLTAEQLDYLRALPRDITLTVAGRLVRAYHGRFTIPHVVMPVDGRPAIQQALDAVGASDITIMADSHHPFMVMQNGRMLVNTGSTGNPCDRVPKASYYILTDRNGVLESAHIRVDYDIERAVADALATPDLPMQDCYIQELRQAVYMRLKPREV